MEYVREFSRNGLAMKLGTAAITLYTIALHANTEGRAFPSGDTLAREIGATRRTVMTHVRQLEACGAIVVSKRPLDSGGWGNEYHLQPIDSIKRTLARRDAKKKCRLVS
jgi:predicted transcriptional regulator